MARSFSMSIAEDPESLILRAQVLAGKHDFVLRGDMTEGHFSGKGIDGTYQLEGSVLNITVLRKPRLLPWLVVEIKLREFLG